MDSTGATTSQKRPNSGTSSDEESSCENEGKNAKVLVWNFYEKISKKQAKCKLCNRMYSTNDGSISGLKYHLFSRHQKIEFQPHKLRHAKKLVKGQTTLRFPASVPPSTPSENIINEAILDAIIKDSRPFGDFEKPGMKSFLAKVLPHYQPIGRKAVARKINVRYKKIKNSFKKDLQDSKGISFSTDIWTSLQKKSYMVTTVHMQSQNGDGDQPKLIHTVLDFWEFRGSHTASGICSRLKKVFDKYGILDKIIAGTTDSGANVKKAINVLLKEHIKNLIWLPCLAHRIHLVVCNGLGLWRKCKTESSETDEEYDSTAEENPDMESSANEDSEGGSDLEVESDYQDSVDNEEDIEEDAWGSENIQNRESDSNQLILSTALKKVRRTVNFFSRSSRWMDVLRKKVTSSKTAIHKRIPQPDCKTRWNSTYDMLSNYLEHKEVVNDVLGEVALQNREMMNKVESLTLTRREIDAINQLCTLLQPFKKMTIVMSGSNYATVSMAMAFIKAMNEACSPKDDDAEMTRALKAGLNEQLDSYFYDEGTADIKKSLHIYKEAAYLDPRYHTSLTKSECKVVEIALKRSFMSGKECEIEAFEKNAERKKSHSQTNTDAQTSSYVTLPAETKAFDALDDLLESVGLSLSQEDGESDEDEFQTFKSLRATFKPREETSLGFWKRYEHVLPNLANRALKILCIPLTSIASESAFSQSSYIVRKQRVRLGGNVVGKLMFLKDKV